MSDLHSSISEFPESGSGKGNLKVAIVHDWLPVYAGAERVLEQMILEYPQAEVFTLIDLIPEKDRSFLGGCPVHTSFIQRLPFSKKHYRKYVFLAPLAVEQFDLTRFDLVLSSSYVVAKAAITSASQLHISYVHSPVRYAWDLQFQYLKELGLEKGIRSWVFRLILHYLRQFDVNTVNRVDHFVANSEFVRQRIRKTWNRDADVIYPPVDVRRFQTSGTKEEYYITASRLVPYKKIHLIAEAFKSLPDQKLIIVGDGPEKGRIQKVAGPNVELRGWVGNEELSLLLQNAKAFIFAAEEDFGIAPVEALAAGTPVLAYGKGGALESVISGKTGRFFDSQSSGSISDAVLNFENNGVHYGADEIRQSVLKFAPEEFRTSLRRLIAKSLQEQHSTGVDQSDQSDQN